MQKILIIFYLRLFFKNFIFLTISLSFIINILYAFYNFQVFYISTITGLLISLVICLTRGRNHVKAIRLLHYGLSSITLYPIQTRTILLNYSYADAFEICKKAISIISYNKIYLENIQKGELRAKGNIAEKKETNKKKAKVQERREINFKLCCQEKLLTQVNIRVGSYHVIEILDNGECLEVIESVSNYLKSYTSAIPDKQSSFT